MTFEQVLANERDNHPAAGPGTQAKWSPAHEEPKEPLEPQPTAAGGSPLLNLPQSRVRAETGTRYGRPGDEGQRSLLEARRRKCGDSGKTTIGFEAYIDLPWTTPIEPDNVSHPSPIKKEHIQTRTMDNTRPPSKVV